MNLPSNLKNLSKGQKLFALVLLAGAGLLGMKIFNMWLAPLFIGFFKNFWKMIYLGVPAVFLIWYVISNPLVIWGFFKTLSWNITKMFIKMDPLSVMDRYADLLDMKLNNLNKIKVGLKGRQVALGREIQRLKDLIALSLKRGQAALKVGDQSTASLEGSRAQGAQDSLKLFTPNFQRVNKSIEFLDLLSKNWSVSQTRLREEIARKRSEYEILKADAKALNQAEAFIKGDTEEGKLYQESLKALEQSVGQKIAYIEDFETRSKDIMNGIKVENQMQTDEGLKMLEQYIQDGKLMLPDDFTKVEDISYEMVPNKAGAANDKYNLLK